MVIRRTVTTENEVELNEGSYVIRNTEMFKEWAYEQLEKECSFILNLDLETACSHIYESDFYYGEPLPNEEEYETREEYEKALEEFFAHGSIFYDPSVIVDEIANSGCEFIEVEVSSRYGMYFDTYRTGRDGYHHIVLDIEEYMNYCAELGEEVELYEDGTYKPVEFEENYKTVEYEVGA